MQTIIYVLLFSAIFCGNAISTQAQNFSEWWQQKKTRIKYLVAQVAALETFEKTVAKGYSQAEAGIDTFVVITNGEFHLHEEHFRSLSLVNPTVRHSIEAGACVREYRALLDEIANFGKRYSNSPWLTPDDKRTIIQIIKTIVEKTETDSHQIVNLIADDRLKMTDGERLKALEDIYGQARKRTDHFFEIEEIVAHIVMEKIGAFREETMLKILE
jgi:hypothetical protein